MDAIKRKRECGGWWWGGGGVLANLEVGGTKSVGVVLTLYSSCTYIYIFISHNFVLSIPCNDGRPE